MLARWGYLSNVKSSNSGTMEGFFPSGKFSGNLAFLGYIYVDVIKVNWLHLIITCRG